MRTKEDTVDDQLRGLKVNGLVGDDAGRAVWRSRVQWAGVGARKGSRRRDQVFSLDWPGIENAEQRIARATIDSRMTIFVAGCPFTLVTVVLPCARGIASAAV